MKIWICEMWSKRNQKVPSCHSRVPLSSPACESIIQGRQCLSQHPVQSTHVILGKFTCPRLFILVCIFSQVCLISNPPPQHCYSQDGPRGQKHQARALGGLKLV